MVKFLCPKACSIALGERAGQAVNG